MNCPTCGAKPGEPCRRVSTITGLPTKTIDVTHPERRAIGSHVRYSGPITARPCSATVEYVDLAKVGLRLGNGALFLADPADIEVEET